MKCCLLVFNAMSMLWDDNFHIGLSFPALLKANLQQTSQVSLCLSHIWSIYVITFTDNFFSAFLFAIWAWQNSTNQHASYLTNNGLSSSCFIHILRCHKLSFFHLENIQGGVSFPMEFFKMLVFLTVNWIKLFPKGP